MPRKSGPARSSPNEPDWPYRGEQCVYDAQHGRCKMPASMSPHEGSRRRRYCRYHFNIAVNGALADTSETWPGDTDDWFLVNGRYPEMFDPGEKRCVDCNERARIAEMHTEIRGVVEVFRCSACYWAMRQDRLERKNAEGQRGTAIAVRAAGTISPGSADGGVEGDEAAAAD